MGCVAVDNLSQGMVLSADVRDVHCRLLLSKGQVISDKHLRILKIWGVCEVHVVGDGADRAAATEAADPDQVAMAREAVDFIFKNLDTRHETIRMLHQAAVTYRCQHPTADSRAERLALPANGAGGVAVADIRQRIEKSALKLPDAPAIINELNAVIADPFATSNDVARVVHKSPTLASLLLRIVNSAYYGFPSKIDRITRAVTIIGTKEISSLALAICVMRAFKDIPSGIINMPSFIRHSLACGLIARIIAAQKNLAETEQVSVAGLLHDIGKLIALKHYPDQAVAAFAHAAAAGDAVYLGEKAVLGVYHTQMAKYLLAKWQIPETLASSVVYHHHPAGAVDVSKAAIVQMADIITNGLGLGSSGEQCIPGFDDKAWDALGIPACNLTIVIRQALHQLGALDFALME